MKKQTGAWKSGLWLALFLLVSFSVRAAEIPGRVVSINVCTDQLAMLLADKGQLQSVSYFARDPLLSVMSGQAASLPVNHAQAEEVFLMKPDLVLAGTFSSRATVGLLRELGVRVEEFAPARSFADIFAHLERMGALLGREEKARAEISSMKARLAAIQTPQRKRSIALYYANSYTAGRGTLIDDAVRLAGLDNMASAMGVDGPAFIPLELLVMEKPDILVRSERDRAPSLAKQNFEHPALRALERETEALSLADNLTVCGGPFSVEAVEKLAEVAHD